MSNRVWSLGSMQDSYWVFSLFLFTSSSSSFYMSVTVVWRIRFHWEVFFFLFFHLHQNARNARVKTKSVTNLSRCLPYRKPPSVQSYRPGVVVGSDLPACQRIHLLHAAKEYVSCTTHINPCHLIGGTRVTCQPFLCNFAQRGTHLRTMHVITFPPCWESIHLCACWLPKCRTG